MHMIFVSCISILVQGLGKMSWDNGTVGYFNGYIA